MAGLDRVELADGEVEALGNLTKELLLLPMDSSSAFAMWKRPSSTSSSNLRLPSKTVTSCSAYVSKLAGVPLGGIEERRGLLHLCGRDLECLFEGFDLVGGDGTVSLGHLGGTMTPTVNGTSLSGSEYALRA
jgi:hypothetical protein